MEHKTDVNTNKERRDALDCIEVFCRDVNRLDMRTKARRVEQLLISIFDREDSRPEQMAHTEKLKKTYLPITLKSLNRYLEMQNNQIEGESFDEMGIAITRLLNSITVAMTEIREKMFEDDMTGISIDVNVLQTLMKQDGLLSKDELNAIKVDAHEGVQ